MRLKIPYFKQQSAYLCGPASLQMVSAFFGVAKTQEDFLDLLGISDQEAEHDGLANQAMIEAACRAGFYCYVNENTSLEEIKYFINLGLPVIVNYIEPSEDEGHYAVAIGYGKLLKRIIFNDPWNGRNFSLGERAFLRRWHSGFERHRHWLLVISREPLTIGQQFSPRS